MPRSFTYSVPTWGALATCFFLIFARPSLAIGPDAQPEFDLQSTLLAHKQYLIRDFSAEPVVRWRWTGSSLEPIGTPQLRTVGVFLPSGVRLNHNTLTIEGLRRTVTKVDTGYAMSPAAERIQVEVDLHGGDPATVLPQLPGLLFYSDLKEALAALPKASARVLTPMFPGHKSANLGTCDCADTGTPACEGKQASIGLTHPLVVKSPDPHFSDEARKQKLNGDVQIALTADEHGAPMDLWLTSPAGAGLDESAADTVHHYVFKPATCHSKPIQSDTRVDVSFRIY